MDIEFNCCIRDWAFVFRAYSNPGGFKIQVLCVSIILHWKQP